MEDRLAGGDQSAVAALGRMGVHFEDIKALGSNDMLTLFSTVSSHGEHVVATWSKLVVRGD